MTAVGWRVRYNPLRGEAVEERVQIETVNADMRAFSLREPVDFCYILLGSLAYVGSRQGLLSHLACIAQALQPGGLYLIENLLMDWVKGAFVNQEDWTMERNAITVQTQFKSTLRDPLAQTANQTLEFTVDDHGEKKVFLRRVYNANVLPARVNQPDRVAGRFRVDGVL